MAKDDLVPVRMLVSVAGEDFSWTPEQVVHMPADEAAKWADGQRGEYTDPPPPSAPGRGRDGTEIETTEANPRPAGTRNRRRAGAGTETT